MKNPFYIILIFLLIISSCESQDNEIIVPSSEVIPLKPHNQNPPVVVEEGLIAYYPFNGDAREVTGYVNNGYVMGPLLSYDRNNNHHNSYYFNGNEDRIQVPFNSKLEVNTTFTLMVWFASYEAKKQKIINNRNRYDLELTQTGEYSFTIYTNIESKQLNFPGNNTNEWQSIIIVKDNTNLSLYVNGIKVDQNTILGDIIYYSNSDNYLTIGNTTSGPYNIESFNGKIDDIKIYEKAFTESEVLQYYNDNL